jgi:SAM-dependent methyltransferase
VARQKKYYDNVYSSKELIAHWENAPGKQVILDGLRHFLPKSEEGRDLASIVDIGCGTGFLLNEIHQRLEIKKLFGVDFSLEAIRIGRNRYRHIKFLCGDGAMTGICSGSMDYLVSYGSYEHFANPKAGIAEAGRILKGNGIFLMMMPTLGIDRNDRSDEGWYEERKVDGCPIRQMQWNLRRETWESYFEGHLELFDMQLATSFGAIKSGVFFFGYKP